MNVFLKDKTAVQVTNDKIVLSKYTNVFIGAQSGMNGAGKTSLYIGYDATDTSDKRPIYGNNVDGNPETVVAKPIDDILGTQETYTGDEGSEVTSIEVANEVPSMKEAIDKVMASVRNGCIEATRISGPQKYAYHALYKNFYTAAGASPMVWDNVAKAFTAIHDKIKSKEAIPTLADATSQRYFINEMMKMLAYSAKSAGLNQSDDVKKTDGKSYEKVSLIKDGKKGTIDTIGELQGHRSRVDDLFGAKFGQGFGNAVAGEFGQLRSTIASQK
jgi:hypothetical protein